METIFERLSVTDLKLSMVCWKTKGCLMKDLNALKSRLADTESSEL